MKKACECPVEHCVEHDYCRACDDPTNNHLYSGVSGVLVVGDNVERCDACERFSSDEEARLIRKASAGSMTPYVSIDIETTGLNPQRHQVLEFAAVIENWQLPVDKLPRFHAILEHNDVVGQPYALQLNQRLLRILAGLDPLPETHCRDVFVHPGDLYRRFKDFLFDNGIPLKATAAGKNFAGFDLQFLKQLPRFKAEWLFRHRTIDPALFFWDPLNDDAPPGLDKCRERAGLTNHFQAHCALDDAVEVVRLIRAGACARFSLQASQ